MKLFLDCGLTQLSLSSKLISLVLVAGTGQQFYVELRGTYHFKGCSDLVIPHVLPQLDSLGRRG